MSARLPLILLPPSEGKRAGGGGPPWRPGAMAVDLDEQRLAVLDALAGAMAQESVHSKLLGVKGDALAAAAEANRSVRTSPTLPAIERYDGVLYGALDAAGLDTAARRRLRSSVLVVSGLWGLVAPNDPVPDYKLKMGASLAPIGKLSTWWRDPITAALVPRSERRVVWNLLPQEHDAAWRPAEVPCVRRHTVRFLDRHDDGSLSTVSHWNKFLKGALVRFLVEHPGASLDDLAAWRHPSGYSLERSMTEDDGVEIRLSFLRRAA